jgi:hypothetical protein
MKKEMRSKEVSKRDSFFFAGVGLTDVRVDAASHKFENSWIHVTIFWGGGGRGGFLGNAIVGNSSSEILQ